jgi:zinc/manganese transport system permease protein
VPDRAVRGWPHPRGDHAVAASYVSNWPIGFFVGTLGAVSYGTGHGWAAWRRTRAPGADPRPLAA